MKTRTIVIVILVGLMGTCASAATRKWTGGGGLELPFWDVAANWDGGAPTAADMAYILIDDANCVIDELLVDANEAICDWMRTSGVNSALQVNGGTLRVTNRCQLAWDQGSTFTLRINSGQAFLPTSTLGKFGTGTFEVNGGLLSLNGQVDMHRGKVDEPGMGYININGGRMECAGLNGTIKSPDHAPYEVNVAGGTFAVETLDLRSDALIADISGGAIELNGDATEQVQGYATSGLLTAMGMPATRGGLIIDYDADADLTMVTFDAALVDLNKAWLPTPVGSDTTLDSLLTWKTGDNAASTQGHDVYFGTDEAVVAAATVADPMGVYKGRQDATSFNPGELMLDQAYYWRVDQVNKDTGVPYKGNVWSFTVVTWRIIDSFDTYPTSQQLLEVWTEAVTALSWIGIVGDVSVDVNSMELTANLTEGPADMILDMDAQDWTTNGAKVLSFWFKGDPNATELVVSVTSGSQEASQTITEPGVVRSSIWRSVDIPLADFAGLDLTAVTRLVLSVAGTGNVRVNYDTLGLTGSRCLSDRVDLPGDLNDDCRVDEADLAILEANMGAQGYTVNAAAMTPNLDDPNDPNNPLVWLTFDDIEDPNAPNLIAITAQQDRLGRFNVNLQGNTVLQPEGGVNGTGFAQFSLSPFDDVVSSMGVPNSYARTEPLRAIGAQVSFSFWIKGVADIQPWADENVFHTWNFSTSFACFMHCPDSRGQVSFTHGWPQKDTVTWKGSTPADWEGEWNYYVAVKDVTQTLQQIYRNGELVAENKAAVHGGDLPSNLQDLNIAKGGYHGNLDDFRIYDRALTHAEILGLAGIDTLDQGLVTPADINGDDVVDEADLAILEANMGTEKLWP